MKKKITAGVLLILLLAGVCIQPAYANSAQRHWRGTDGTGAVVTGEDCPIVVDKELLTFDVQEFPEQYYPDTDSFLAYTGNVTAEYIFRNPANYAVTATLVFPFGTPPDYGHIRNDGADGALHNHDTEKYGLSVNGEAIDCKIRHTLSPWGSQFDLDKDMSKLHDGFLEDPFYTPDVDVEIFIYSPSDVNTEAYPAATAAFILSVDPAKTKVYMENQSGGRLLENAVQMQGWVNPNEPFTIYVIGEPLKEQPKWKFYENGACEKEIGGTMIPANMAPAEPLTLKDFLLQEYDPDSGILDYDWYNAMVTALNFFEWEYGAIHSEEIDFNISDRLMRWYEYTLTLEPGQTLKNAVTAPLYPAIDAGYTPSLYSYTYLLSPAKTWAQFGELEVVVKTPYYMTECGIDGVIIPDLPFREYEENYKAVAQKYDIRVIMLITPETSEKRIREIDAHTDGFIYMVSSAATTGAQKDFDARKQVYFKKIQDMNLRNPRMVGFGISNRQTFDTACSHASGAIIGSRFVTLLDEYKGNAQKAISHLKEDLGKSGKAVGQ